jgi:polyribonucleotide nucleotidyltransferase
LLIEQLRPLFPEDYHADTQIMLSLISSDKKTMPDALVGLAASAAVIAVLIFLLMGQSLKYVLVKLMAN